VYPPDRADDLSVDEIPFIFVGGISSEGKLWVYAGDILQVIPLQTGDLLVMDARVIHAGCGYSETNFRWHGYIDSSSIKHSNESQEYLKYQLKVQPIIEEVRLMEWTKDKFMKLLNKNEFDKLYPWYSYETFLSYVDAVSLAVDDKTKDRIFRLFIETLST
jgi:hypothetical protein